MDAAAIRQARLDNPKLRERDLARIHGIAEASLVAAHVGHGATRLRPEAEAILVALKAVGEVLALTRNESAVHEKIGIYDGVHMGAGAGVVLGTEIDLRVFPLHWQHAFAVDKTGEDGAVKKSLQFFDAAGDAAHKIHLRETSDVEAFAALVEQFKADDQTASLPALTPFVAPVAGPPASREALHEAWGKLTDTHQFFPMLKKLNLARLDAVSMAHPDYAYPLQPDATAQLIDDAVTAGLPIMAFVGNRGCVQIHTGPIHNVQPMGPWLNIMDENFHLHLRLDHIAELWVVKKPTAKGHVTSVEAYGADRSLIIQFFGIQERGLDNEAWLKLVAALPRRQSAAA